MGCGPRAQHKQSALLILGAGGAHRPEDQVGRGQGHPRVTKKGWEEGSSPRPGAPLPGPQQAPLPIPWCVLRTRQRWGSPEPRLYLSPGSGGCSLTLKDTPSASWPHQPLSPVWPGSHGVPPAFPRVH